MRTSILRAVALLVLPGVAPVSASAAATFTLLGTLPDGPNSTPFAVSSNGAVVAGTSDSIDGTQAFRWTGGVMTGLGFLSSDPDTGAGFSTAAGISGDGDVTVGTAVSADITQATVWTEGVPTFGIGVLPGDTFSNALDVSADGLVVVGSSTLAVPDPDDPDVILSSTSQAFRWTAGPITGLGTLAGDTSSIAFATSADGAVVVGESSRVTGVDPDTDEDIIVSQAFRWTGGLMTGLGTLSLSVDPDDLPSSTARDVSTDGSVVVGASDYDTGDPDDPLASTEAFLWTAADGMVGLGFLPDSDTSTASAVSGDGSVVVGQSGGQAFIWTAATGMQPLISVLIAGGAPGLEFASLRDAIDISADGLSIVGIRSPGAFLATYSPGDLLLVPDPFVFEGQTGVEPSTEVTSDVVTITGFTGDTPVTVSGGEYSVGCGATFTSAPGTLAEGQTICVRQTSAVTGSTNQNTFLTVGGVTGLFTSRTGGPSTPTPSSSAMDGLSLFALGLVLMLGRKRYR